MQKKNRLLFDTNAILRYILQDNPTMANAVEAELESNTGNCLITTEVITEMVYVLTKVYKINRRLVAETIEGIANLDVNPVANCDVVCYALNLYATTNLDFVDRLLIGYAKVKNYTVFTFDKDLKKHLK
ncbi:MAG: PIN domain-containing protein [Candidatus Azobacteroides sp.]|nr:PIN domain-containing protein [Candidatus Azobacteroides sp.]